MYFMSDPQALHVTRNVIPGKLGVDLHLHRVHIPLVPPQIAQSGVCTAVDRVYLRGPIQLICKCDVKIPVLNFLLSGQWTLDNT